jgi:hypothetical protein
LPAPIVCSAICSRSSEGCRGDRLLCNRMSASAPARSAQLAKRASRGPGEIVSLQKKKRASVRRPFVSQRRGVRGRSSPPSKISCSGRLPDTERTDRRRRRGRR